MSINSLNIIYYFSFNCLKWLSIAELPLPINITAISINALNTQPTEIKVTTNYSRDLAILVKIYIKESKYSKEDDNFYNRVNIPQEAKIKGFLIMLYSITFNFYYKNKVIYITFNSICNTIYNYFKGLEYKSGVLIK